MVQRSEKICSGMSIEIILTRIPSHWSRSQVFTGGQAMSRRKRLRKEKAQKVKEPKGVSEESKKN